MSYPGTLRYKCSAPECKNVFLTHISDKKHVNKHFFKFPCDMERRSKWYEAVNTCFPHCKFLDNKTYRFCEDHFSLNAFTSTERKNLNRYGFPSLFGNNVKDNNLKEQTETQKEPTNTEQVEEFIENFNKFIEEPLNSTEVDNRTVTQEPKTPTEEFVLIFNDHDYITPETLNRSQSNKKDDLSTESFPAVQPVFSDEKDVTYQLVKVQDNSQNLYKLIPIEDTTEITVNYDLIKTCRLCLNQTNELVSLFDKNTINENELLYKEMVVECASVKIEENDKLPKGICSQCIEKLNSSYKFRKLCEKSEASLNKFLNKFDNNSNTIAKENTSNVEENRKNSNVIEIIEDESSKTVLESEPKSQTCGNKEDLQKLRHIRPCQYICKICNINFSSFRLLSIHLKKTHKNLKSYACRICFKKFNCAYNLNAHVRNVHINKKFKCQICTKSFKKRYAFIEHLRAHADKKSFICKICNKGFSRENGLRRHLKRHTNQKVYSCQVCKKVISGRINFQIHMKSHNSPKKYVCEICGNVYKSLGYLKTHKRRHTGEKPFSCTECGKAFVYRDGLRAHLRTHSDERPYLCTFCGLSFKSLESLKKHSFSHSSEKQFTCHICFKKFVYNSGLRLHLKTHFSYRYVCNYCDKGYHRLDYFKIHVMQVHTGERPYICHICGKGFVRIENLRAHLKKHE